MTTASGRNTCPLDGFRVLDFTHAAAGPYATMFLADLGAEIVKIEKPAQGDGARTMGVPMPGQPRKQSDYFVALNRNKRSVGLDISKPDGQRIARELAAKSDIVMQNFRPGVMERLGLGFDDLKKVRRGLVYGSISAFGPTGPLAGRPANDIIMQSVSGLMSITGEVGGGPVRIGAPISDFSSGLFALSGVLAALLVRERHPEGQHIQVSMLDASLNMMCNYIPAVAGLGHRVPRLGRGHAQIVPYQAFVCADGEYVMVGAFTRGFWQNLARALGHEDWIADPRFATNAARLANRDVLIGMLSEIFAAQKREHWLAVLEAADVPNSPVYELHDAVHGAQVAHNGTIVSVGPPGRAAMLAQTPIRNEAWSAPPPSPAPVVGEHTQDVLCGLLGYPPDRVRELAAEGLVDVAMESGS